VFHFSNPLSVFFCRLFPFQFNTCVYKQATHPLLLRLSVTAVCRMPVIPDSSVCLPDQLTGLTFAVTLASDQFLCFADLVTGLTFANL